MPWNAARISHWKSPGKVVGKTLKFGSEEIYWRNSQKELRTGRIFPLPDGTSLKVQFFTSGIRVLRNDKPLPGSISDPTYRLANAFGVIYFIAGLNILLGFIALFFQVEFLQTLGFGIISAAIGFVFLVLGFFTQRRSRIALIAALIIFGLDCALAFRLAPFF
jgi:hypothetical protein